jgi:hypothetical protein
MIEIMLCPIGEGCMINGRDLIVYIRVAAQADIGILLCITEEFQNGGIKNTGLFHIHKMGCIRNYPQHG